MQFAVAIAWALGVRATIGRRSGGARAVLRRRAWAVARYCHVVATSQPCGHVVAIAMPLRHAIALPLPCDCHCHDIAIPFPSHSHAVVAESLPCRCDVLAMSLPFCCIAAAVHVVAMSLPCRCRGSAMSCAVGRRCSAGDEAAVRWRFGDSRAAVGRIGRRWGGGAQFAPWARSGVGRAAVPGGRPGGGAMAGRSGGDRAAVQRAPRQRSGVGWAAVLSGRSGVGRTVHRYIGCPAAAQAAVVQRSAGGLGRRGGPEVVGWRSGGGFQRALRRRCLRLSSVAGRRSCSAGQRWAASACCGDPAAV